MKKWEYKVVSFKATGSFRRSISTDEINAKFTELGNEGWEFVESQRIDSSSWTDALIFIFRKLKEE